jgi:hypothetical protein
MSRKTLSIEYEKLTSLTWTLGRIRKERKATEFSLDQLEWLLFHHMGVVTEHFRVWLEEYFLQPLRSDPRQKD